MGESAAIVPQAAAAGAADESALVAASGGDDEPKLGEDGRLLKMFVQRNIHLEGNAKERAVTDWLIRETFYNKRLDEFVRRYAPSSDALVLAEDEKAKIVKSCEEALRDPKAEVSQLEKDVRAADGDVHQLRDLLMTAVNEMITPRRKPTATDDPRRMTEEAIEAMRNKRQVRLRSVVFACLQGIWKSGVGGEVLKVAMDQVHKLIQKFEVREDDVREAASGGSWHTLKELVGEIEGQLPESMRRRTVEVEGKGHKHLIKMAIDDMDGEASTEEIFQWIEAHPEVTEAQKVIRLNRNVREKADGKSTYTVWKETVRGCLWKDFQKSQEKRADDGKYVWRVKDAEGASPPPLRDAAADGGGGGEAGGSQASSSPALPLQDGEAASPGGAAKPRPGRRRKAEPKAAAGAAAEAAPALSGSDEAAVLPDSAGEADALAAELSAAFAGEPASKRPRQQKQATRKRPSAAKEPLDTQGASQGAEG